MNSDAYQPESGTPSNQNGQNAFLTELNPTGDALVYSTYFGGEGADDDNQDYVSGDYGYAIALDPAQNVYITGTASSPNFPVTANAYQKTDDTVAGFIAKFAFGTKSVTATPTFSRAAGAYTADQTVTISDTTPNATFYYTTNGATPTTNSTLYTGPIHVTASETIQAIAVAPGYTVSAVASAAYIIKATVAAPTFNPVHGTYTAPQSVTISTTTPGATIYYTTDGCAPKTSSAKYTRPIAVSSTTTIQAIAIAPGYFDSTVARATYTIHLTAATPVFSPAAGTYSSTQSVTITDKTPGASIYYTTNGTTPTTSSTPYTGAISLSKTTSIHAKAFADGYTESASAVATYTIQ